MHQLCGYVFYYVQFYLHLLDGSNVLGYSFSNLITISQCEDNTISTEEELFSRSFTITIALFMLQIIKHDFSRELKIYRGEM